MFPLWECCSVLSNTQTSLVISFLIYSNFQVCLKKCLSMFFSLATTSNLFFFDSTSFSQIQLALQIVTPGIHLLCHLSAQPLWNIAISLVLLASFHRDRKYFGDLCSFATARPMQGRNKAGGQWVLEGQERLEGRFHPGIRV